jgi:hypothetical protein
MKVSNEKKVVNDQEVNRETLHIYTRVSKKTFTEFLDTQKCLGIKKANELGMKYEIWDEGKASAHKEDLVTQPKMVQLLLAIEEGSVKHLFVTCNDRLSRNEITQQVIRVALLRNNVVLYTSGGRLDLSNPNDRIVNDLLNSIDFNHLTTGLETYVGEVK